MYTIYHISGEKNVMADIMTRWYAGYSGKRALVKRITSALMNQDLVPSTEFQGLQWPTEDDIIMAQNLSQHRPKDAS